jgi:hypothetical protein
VTLKRAEKKKMKKPNKFYVYSHRPLKKEQKMKAAHGKLLEVTMHRALMWEAQKLPTTLISCRYGAVDYLFCPPEPNHMIHSALES